VRAISCPAALIRSAFRRRCTLRKQALPALDGLHDEPCFREVKIAAAGGKRRFSFGVWDNL